MTKDIIYGQDKILQYGENDFSAFYLNEDNDVCEKKFNSLEAAQQWLDKIGE